MAKAKTKDKIETSSTPILPPLTSFIETDCVGFDLAISNGKGIPEGGNILLFAPPGAGKTTLIADVIRRLLVKHENAGIPFRVVYIDSENSLTVLNCIGKDSKNPEELGLQKYITSASLDEPVPYQPQQLIYYPNIHLFTEIEALYAKYAGDDIAPEDKDVKCIVVDSLTNLNSTILQEAAVDKADYGSNARERNRFYLKWLPKTRAKGIITFFTSQVRQKQGATAYEDPKRPAVTDGDEHNMDVIMKLSKSTDSKRIALKKVKQKTIDGIVEVQTRYILKLSTSKTAHTKNRIWSSVDVECLVKPGSRILNAYTVFNIIEQNDFYKKQSAGYYSVSDDLRAALPDIDFGDPTKYILKKDLNRITSLNMGTIVEFLKDNDMFTATVGEIEEPDDGILG